jgi:hypothetical protein
MKFNELKKITSQKELFNKSELMTMNRLAVYEQYLQKYIDRDGCYGVEPYYVDTFYISTTGNFRFRFIEVEFENDTVGIFFKYISMFGNVYVRLFREPVSLNGICENEMLVLNTLYENNLFKCVVVPHFYNIDKSKIKPFDNDYFNDVNERCEYISKGKFKSKHGINRLKNEYDIVFKVNNFNEDELNDLNNKWWETKKRTTQKDTLVEGLIKLSKQCDKIYILTWEYKSQPIAFTILTDRHNGYCCGIKVNKNLAKTGYIKDEFLCSKLGSLVHYDTMLFCKEKGFKYAYISGDIRHKFLRKYKSSNYKYIIDYYVVDRDEFMELYNKKENVNVI